MAKIKSAFSRLPQTKPELESLGEFFKVNTDSLLLGSGATEKAVKSWTKLQSAEVIAFATHAVVADQIVGLEEPGLILTPPNKPTIEDDGLLTSSEIAQLQLSADWVLLSACNTAAADGRPGAEALSGLARAFFYAGTKSLVVSHWPVRDAVAAKLTTLTAEKLADSSMTRARALQLAMREVMTENIRFAHPSAWASLMLVGDTLSTRK